MTYKTRGVCSQEIHLELDNDIIKFVEFIGGCSGNTQGVARLVTGMKYRTRLIKWKASNVVLKIHPVRTSWPRL